MRPSPHPVGGLSPLRCRRIVTTAWAGWVASSAWEIANWAGGCVQCEMLHFGSFDVDLKSSRGTGDILPGQVTPLVPQHGKLSAPASLANDILRRATVRLVHISL